MESASLTSKLKEPASHITLQTSEVAWMQFFKWGGVYIKRAQPPQEIQCLSMRTQNMPIWKKHRYTTVRCKENPVATIRTSLEDALNVLDGNQASQEWSNHVEGYLWMIMWIWGIEETNVIPMRTPACMLLRQGTADL
jgi:hypothetical protein